MWMVERSEAAGIKTSEVRDWRPEAGSRRSEWNFCVMKLDPRGGYRGEGGARGGGVRFLPPPPPLVFQS